MIDEIYPRLFLEVIPEDIKKRCPDFQLLMKGKETEGEISPIFGKLINTIYKQNPNSDIGLQYGKYLWPQTLCDYTRVMMTSNDVGSVLNLTERTHPAHGASYYPFMLNKDKVFSLALTFPYKSYVSPMQRRFCIESVFSFTANGIKSTTELDFKPLFASFDFPEPRYVNEYRAMFGDNLRFNAPLNMIEFDDRYLLKRLSTRNPTLHQLYLKKSRLGHQEKPNETNNVNNSFEQTAIAYMIKHCPESFSCQNLAQHMNISVRGLQQKLKQQGVTFSDICNLTRRELTKIYLIQERQTIDWTTDKLGFESRSGFSRFFKKEFHSTPSDFLASAYYS